MINLDPAIGAEIRKMRPAVVVNDDAVGILPLRVIAPITEWKERYSVSPWMVKLAPDPMNGLEKYSAVDAFQVRSLSQQRFSRRLGQLPEETMRQITVALATVLAIRL
jgi:mRNA interferase MazF